MNKKVKKENLIEETWNIRPNPLKLFFSNHGGIIIVLIAMMGIAAIFRPVFLRPSNLLGIIINSNDIYLAGFGMTFVILSAGIDLSQGSLSAMSGMIIAMLLGSGMNFVLAILITLVIGAFCGVLNGAVISLAKVPPFVVTPGTMGIFRGAAMMINAGYSKAIDINNPFLQFTNGSTFGISNMIYVVVIVYIICYILLHKTNIGRNVYAIGGNKEAANLAGIGVVKTTIFVYVMCSVLISLAGVILAGRMYAGLPSASVGLETKSIAAVILGGTSFNGGDGKIFGTVVGVLILSVLLNVMVLFSLSADLQQIVQGVIIIIAVIYDSLRRKNA